MYKSFQSSLSASVFTVCSPRILILAFVMSHSQQYTMSAAVSNRSVLLCLVVSLVFMASTHTGVRWCPMVIINVSVSGDSHLYSVVSLMSLADTCVSNFARFAFPGVSRFLLVFSVTPGVRCVSWSSRVSVCVQDVFSCLWCQSVHVYRCLFATHLSPCLS